jgi:hypothetical protein
MSIEQTEFFQLPVVPPNRLRPDSLSFGRGYGESAVALAQAEATKSVGRRQPQDCQNVARRPNCMRRGPTRVPVIRPKFGLLVVKLADPNCVWFHVLNVSHRNCRL